MESIVILSDRIFDLVEWAWRAGGWWAVGGAVSLILIIGLGIQTAPNR